MNNPLITRIFAMAKEYYALMSDTDAEYLSYDDYTNLLEYEAKLNAYGNLLTAKQPAKFLRHELRDAKDYLRCTQQRLRVGRPK
jgi:outer membrane protein TolC